MISDGVIISIISTVGGILIAYLSNLAKNKMAAAKSTNKPKDRMELIFEGYEKLIRELQGDIDRKATVIAHFEELANRYRDQIDGLEEEINKLKKELEEARESREQLKSELEALKKEFSKDLGIK